MKDGFSPDRLDAAQLLHEVDRKKVEGIRRARELFEARQRVEGLEKANSILEPSCAELSARVDELEVFRQRYEEIANSTTWRLTRPVRWALERFASIRRRAKRLGARASVTVEAPVPAGPAIDVTACDPKMLEDVAQGIDLAYYQKQLGPWEATLDHRMAAAHYLTLGRTEYLDPHPDFVTRHYLFLHEDVRRAGIDPFWHWLVYGRKEGRVALPHVRRVAQREYKPLVSAVIVGIVDPETLERQIGSIRNQTYSELEILVVDTEENVTTCRRDDDVRVISCPKESEDISLWQVAFREAQGDIIWLREHDVQPEANFVERLVRHFADTSVQVAFGSSSAGESDVAPVIRSAGEWFTTSFAEADLAPEIDGCLMRRHQVDQRVWQTIVSLHTGKTWFFLAELMAGGQLVLDASTGISCEAARATPAQLPDFYKEYQFLIAHLCRKWGIPETEVRRLAERLREMFESASTGSDVFEDVFDLDAILRVQHEPRHIVFNVLGFMLGGGELFPIALANGLLRQGYMVSFLVLDDTRTDPDVLALLDRAIPIYSMFEAKEVGVWRFILDIHADLIHSHICLSDLPFFPDDRTLTVVPYIVTLHGSYECVTLGEDMLARLRRDVTLWVYLAEKNLAHLRGLDGSVPCGDIVHIPNGMTLDRRPFPLTREQLGIGPEDFIVAVASRAIPEKGWVQAAQAIEQLNKEDPPRRVHLLLCGTGDCYEQYREELGRLPNIHLLGYQDCINGLYRMADCMLLPTRFPGESFPLTLIQALQVGTPAIATDVGMVRSMMTADDGGLAGELLPLDADDATFENAIIAAIREMMDDAKRAEFARHARACGQRYGMDRVVAAYDRVYRRFLDVEA
ncbi:glycosyltransferase [Acetobacter estunensis NRIC 0472]|uniref:Glycosyltransferase n=1 Tax=Acetobacter estunensis TaxID=104097 RepID=A0A967EEH7_9PROT|nr:glycosyltransferase [Acetobacter estunensis]NHO55371.1 glycosyltransferase [Acetobacter estunensis]GBQ26507.1 glycosyltransferase [Acetobacter estunensis NRIC 0472]